MNKPPEPPDEIPAGSVDGLTAAGARAEDGLAREWMGPFIRSLRTMPNVTSAARVAGVSRALVYEVREQDADFRAAWDDALEQSYDALEVFSHRMASTGLENVEVRRVVKRELRYPVNREGSPDYTQPPSLVVVEETETRIEGRLISPQMAMFLHRAYRPKKFLPPIKHEHGGNPDGPPVQHEIYRALDPNRALELARAAVELEAGPQPEHPDVEGRSRNGNEDRGR